ncbi:hypothetical protein NDA14_006341 [Ustilago hordei]|uniref:Uncharacterized protein n=1 Tax=Ustilago hordei TaxID=120017 RepID=I2G3P9_USTHO|nr:uncharacterized protein UHO2_00882 [Ustilago hordei]KAJ1603402.1 hypothetical protein NDA14_006341 [Ustilago hordei]CCF53792.1 uncharacterized protein UHOR_00132 [Ustilago hordei]SYW74017.1 uncharacterized protein UHO2_00882 [Ustilago hordei]
MEFFFPTDVFAAYPRQGPSTRTHPFGAVAAGPSTNIFSGCGFDSHALFADNFIDAIQHERAAYARAQAERARRAEAARRAKVAAARRAAEERQAQAYLQHLLQMQQREAQRRYHLEQLHLQRQEAERQRRQQYEEYQRRKAYAIEKERQRIAAARAAQDDKDESKQLFLALEDFIFGLNSFFRAAQQGDDEDEDEEVELAHKNDTQQAAPPAPQAIDVKGKAKAKETNDDNAMGVDHEDSEDTAAALMTIDEDPAEVGPAPSTTAEPTPVPASTITPAPVSKTEQLVFSHAFPADSSFDRTTVRADQINVSVDEAEHKVTVSGLWNDQPSAPVVATSPTVRSASPTPSDTSSRRGRSRSPKRARVSDVDENGEEIVTPETNDGDDDFVEVSFTRASEANKQDKVEKTFNLPQGANVEDLRAELSDEGLKLFTTVSA